ncbi:MAG: ribonuclease P protein component [Alphaproteobacteria bacterium]|jgi:ribonuclease P protein component|nr:ribonuclease P protein component [Alphaproteobacteria bacterium]MBQ8660186.1 ribonuclease P protein component [Alphaproteobacteria bacterium]
MVKFLRKKTSPVKIALLKSRKLDFYRINPVGVMRRGFNRLIRKGIVDKNSERPQDNPNRFVNPAFITHWSPTRFNDGNIHVGFTVSIKSTSKRANKRNLIRRRLKYAVSELIRKYRVEGYDFVFTARSGILDMDYNKIEYLMRHTLKFIESKIKEEISKK